MEPGVPFALLGAVQLLAMAAWVGLAGAAVARRGRRAPGLALPVLLAGLVLLVVADGRVALGFNGDVSDDIGLLRAAGLLLLGVGLLLGSLGGERLRAPQQQTGVLSLAALPGVVVPLGTTTTPALLGAAAGVLAAGAARRARRDGVGILLSLCLVVAGASALASQGADSEGGALLVLVLRGASALLLLAALSLLARRSLLSKVVTAILGGVLVMAVAAVGVVGTVVVASYDEQDRDLVRDAAAQRAQQLDQFVQSRRSAAVFLAVPSACGLVARDRDAAAEAASGLVTPTVPICQAVLETFESRREFVALVPSTGQVRLLAQQDGTGVSLSELLGLRGLPPVEALLGQDCRGARPVTGVTRLTGTTPAVLAFVATPEVATGTTNPCTADGKVQGVQVYGTRLDDDYAKEDVSSVGRNGYTFSLLVGEQLAASNASDNERAQVLTAARRAGVAEGVRDAGVTVAADGQQPTFRFVPLKNGSETIAVLAVSRENQQAQTAQRRALRYLVGTALLTTLLVGALALLLGRRTVEPVRRLTLAAERVAAGDLTVRTAEAGPDEVGTLSRAFDSMTGALAAVNDDLRSSAERLRTILTSVSEGLVATDAHGLVTSINPAALAMSGVPAEPAALGKPLSELLVVRTPGGEPLRLGTPLREADAEVVRLDGTTTPVRVEVAQLTGDAGGVVVVLRDTAREREVERMKTEFLSNVSHELRTPLTPIRGYADLLASRKGLKPEQVEAFAGTILSESLKMNRVVDLLVDVAAIEAGRVHTSPRPVSVASIIDERLAIWRAKAPERATDLRRRVARGLPPVHVDPVWIGKALDELVDNALKHTPPGTALVLGAGPGLPGHVRVSVADRGPGIAEADQALLFTSFEQVDGSATRKVGGLGLGLSFVSRLAEHGGYPISVVSAPGKGAEFSLDLPASAEPPPRRPRARGGARPGRGSRAARRRAPEPGPDR